MKVTLAFSVDSENDRDVLAWWERQPVKSQGFRAVVREHLEKHVALVDVYLIVVDIRKMLQAGAVVRRGQAERSPEAEAGDPLIAAAQAKIDNLGL
jgi:hypothetical protein